MSMRKRLQKTANRSLWSSVLGLLVMITVALSYGYDALQFLSVSDIQSIRQLDSFSRSDKDFALIKSNNIINTEIYVTIDEWFQEKNYYGYIAQLEDKYFLFFNAEKNDISSGNLVLSKWWSQAESMNTFRTMIIEDLTNSSDYTREEVDELIFSKVFLNIDDSLRASLPWAVAWGSVVFVCLIIFYHSLKVKLGIFSDSVESAVLDIDLQHDQILIQNNQWTITQSHLIYHRFFIKAFSVSQIKEVLFTDNRMIVYFRDYRVTISATGEMINRLSEFWEIQRRLKYEPADSL